MVAIDVILLVLSFLCFAISALGGLPSPPRLNLQSAGLAFWVLSVIV